MNEPIFVFGSNLAGRHGAGAALYAHQNCGAVYGQGVGRQGNSYAIPTKDKNIRTLGLGTISDFVEEFLEYARIHPDLQFYITRVGCGLAGYKDTDIAPMFRYSPPNCQLPDEWKKVIAGLDT